MANNYRPGDVNVEECILHSFDGKRTFNLINQVRSIDVFEAVTQPVIYGQFVIADGIGLLEGFPIIGEEYITLKFSTPSLKSLSYKLHVHHVGAVERNPNDRLKMYVLRACSEEAMTNAVTTINRRIRDQISNVIPSIIQGDLKSSKSVRTETTKMVEDHLITKLSPFEAIDKLRHRAVSAKDAGSAYVFYEDSAGFHFVTLESMIKEGKNKVADKIFFFDDNLDTRIEKVRFRDIIGWNESQKQNTIDKLQAGSFGNTVRKFDIITGGLTDVIYESEQFNDKFQKTGKVGQVNTSGFTDKYTDPTGRKFVVPYSSETDTLVPEKVGILHSFVEKVTQNLTQAHIYGDSELMVGDVINCTITSAVGLTGDTTKRTVENNYLVAKIRHMIHIGTRPVYTQAVELINNSFDF